MKTLTDQQKEILLIAQEECAEVTQAISKTFRFGLTESYNGKTNQERLEEEVGDLVCMIELMKDTGIIDPEFVRKGSYSKRSKLEQWSNIFNKEEIA
jgi:NTP pyrophosphatase (non-canonical NTP hydrolase)